MLIDPCVLLLREYALSAGYCFSSGVAHFSTPDWHAPALSGDFISRGRSSPLTFERTFAVAQNVAAIAELRAGSPAKKIETVFYRCSRPTATAAASRHCFPICLGNSVIYG
jgi:hypothetical protein